MPPKPATDPVTAAKPGEQSGATRAEPGKAEPARIEPSKLEPAKVEPGKVGPTPGAPASSAPKPPTAIIPPLAATPQADASRPGPSAGEQPKADATKVDAIKPTTPDAPKPPAPDASRATLGDTPKPAAVGAVPPTAGPGRVVPPTPPNTGPTGTGPQPGPRPAGVAAGAGTALTDGPIIDLKAKRVPDPPWMTKTSPGDGPKDAMKDAARDAKDPPRGPAPAVGATKPGPAGPASAEPAPPRRGGFGKAAAAGLVGGLIGAGLMFGAARTGALGGGDDARLAALDQRLSAQVSGLDQRVGGLATRDALGALDRRVAAVETRAKDTGTSQAPAAAGGDPAQAPTGGQFAVPADLVARLDSLDQRVAALQEEPGRDQPGDAKLGVAQGDGSRQLADLDARVKAMEGAGSKGAGSPAGDVSGPLAALRGEVEARTRASAEADAALGKRVEGLQQALDARTKAATEAVQAATQASRTAAEAGQVQAAEAAKTVDRRFQEQSEKLAALDRSVAQRAEASTVQAALRVVAADRVASALAAGTPYAEPLATLRRLDPAAATGTAALAPFAEAGAPTLPQLAATFRGIADAVAAKRRVARAQAAAAGGDFRAKLLSMADGLVQVRKVDAPAPDGAPDPETKVQAALDRGDASAASIAFDALPPEAQGEAGDFGLKLKARARAGEAARAILADAFKALPAPAAAPAVAPPAAGR